MSLRKCAVLGLLTPSIVALAQPTQAQETSVGPPLVVDSSLPAVTMDGPNAREDAGSRVAIAAGQDGAVVAWIAADNMFRGALLAPDGSIVQSPSFELPSALTQSGRLFGAYGGGRYLFVSHGTNFGAGSAPTELLVLDEQGALLDSTVFDIGECENGAPTYDGSLFLVPCSSWIVAVDASQLAITSFSLTTPLQQPTHGVSCVGASCLAASWYYAADPQTNVHVERFSSTAGSTPIGLGFSDSQLRMLAVTGADDDAFLVLAQCQLSPCGDPEGVAIDHLVGYRVASDDSVTPLDVGFSGDGLTSPRLASNGQSIGIAWRQTSGAQFGTLTRSGASRGASVALSTGYVSSISLASMSTYGYLAAYDEGANVIVRAISTDPNDAEPPPEDEDPGAGGGGAADGGSDKKATDDDGSCSFTPRPPSGSWAWLLLGAAWMARRFRSRRAVR